MKEYGPYHFVFDDDPPFTCRFRLAEYLRDLDEQEKDRRWLQTFAPKEPGE